MCRRPPEELMETLGVCGSDSSTSRNTVPDLIQCGPDPRAVRGESHPFLDGNGVAVGRLLIVLFLMERGG